MTMPGITLGGLFGIWLFQQQATMWSPVAFGGWLLSGVLLFGLWHVPHLRVGRKYVRVTAWVLGMAMLAFYYAQVRADWRLQERLPVHCQQQPLSVRVVIVSVPAQQAYGVSFVARVERVLRHGCHVPERLKLHWYTPRQQPGVPSAGMPLPLRAGERWQFSVKLKQPYATRNPHGFDYAAWCLANHIGAVGSIVGKAPMRRVSALVWQPAALIAHWRQRVGDRMTAVLGQTPESGVLRALVIGDDSQIDRTHWQWFVNTGVNHLMSISGLHITMLAALGYWFARRIWWLVPGLALRMPSKQAASIAGALVAIAYAALAGFSIPTQRTLYMLLTVALLVNVRRRVPFSWVLSAALWVVVLLDPWAVLAPGFWLSFGAVAVLAFAMGGRLHPATWLQDVLHSQWAMTLAFAPVLLALFNQVSLISPLANALAIPLISLAVVPLAIAGSLLPLDAALHVSAWVCQHCLSALHWLQQWPWAVWYQASPPMWAAGLAMLGVLVMLMPKGWPLRWAGGLLCLPMCLPVSPPLYSGQMRVTVLDVGQGLSVLVQTTGHTLLYDAGPALGSEQDAGQRIVLPYLRHLGVRQLSMAVISHDDTDHVGGMASVLQGVPAMRVLSSLTPQAAFFKQMQGKPLSHQSCRQGQHWRWDGVDFSILSPLADAGELARKDNDRSCVLRIQSAHGSLLLTGDIERVAEQDLLQSGINVQSTVMTMPHHGSKTSSSPAFVQAVSPQWAIATAGYLNRFGHPKSAILQRYALQGSTVLRTDRDGAVMLSFLEGVQPQVKNWRQVAPHYWEERAL